MCRGGRSRHDRTGPRRRPSASSPSSTSWPRHPHDRFGLSELARRARAEQADLPRHRHHADRSRLPGPRRRRQDLSAWAAADLARAHRTGVDAGQPRRARGTAPPLAATYDTTAALSAVIDDRITLLELVGPPGADVGCARSARAIRSRRRSGLMFVLWDDEALRSWLAKEPTIPLRTDTERLDRVIAECRARRLSRRAADPGRAAALRADGRHVEHAARRSCGRCSARLISDVGERVYLRSESSRHGSDAAPRHQRHLRAGVRPPPPAGDGGVAADRSRAHRRRDRQAGAEPAGQRRRAHHAARRAHVGLACGDGAFEVHPQAARRRLLRVVVHG